MSKRSCHAKVVKKSFNVQLLHRMHDYRTQHRISASKVSAATLIPECRIKKSERTGNLPWFDMAKLLYFYGKWFSVKLIDEKQYEPEEGELEAEEESEEQNPLQTAPTSQTEAPKAVVPK